MALFRWLVVTLVTILFTPVRPTTLFLLIHPLSIITQRPIFCAPNQGHDSLIPPSERHRRAAAVSPVTAGLPGSWHYGACFVWVTSPLFPCLSTAADYLISDNAHGRIFGFAAPPDPGLTVEGCINVCAGMGMTVAGMEFSQECCAFFLVSSKYMI